MLQTEFTRGLNCNYLRLLLEKEPEEKRYQYCILTRGGIRGLLPCSLRYINGDAYLYYDISSTQNVAQLYGSRKINREWVRDFLWSMKTVKQELGRFLLEDSNVICNPEQIFQDLEKNVFYFMYVPYYQGECSFGNLLNYLVEHIEYEDEILVECVYKMHEQFERSGSAYLQEQIYADALPLEGKIEEKYEEKETPSLAEESIVEKKEEANTWRIEEEPAIDKSEKRNALADKAGEHRGIFSLFESRMKKQKEEREERTAAYEQAGQLTAGYAVAEEPTVYEAEEFGKTMFIKEEPEEEKDHYLTRPDGEIVFQLEKEQTLLGKRSKEADVVLQDAAASRLHARIWKTENGFFLEDLNSTNGTFKNGVKMQPYEKRKLETKDEIRVGKTTFLFR